VTLLMESIMMAPPTGPEKRVFYKIFRINPAFILASAKFKKNHVQTTLFLRKSGPSTTICACRVLPVCLYFKHEHSG